MGHVQQGQQVIAVAPQRGETWGRDEPRRDIRQGDARPRAARDAPHASDAHNATGPGGGTAGTRAGHAPAAPQGPVEGFRERFSRAADRLTAALGSLPALIASVALVVGWLITGPVFGFSDTWQLFINTTTTVVTFWMVFVIQASANRQAKATQLKLDEIIRAIGDARNEFIALDHATDQVLEQHEEEFQALTEVAEGASASAQDRRQAQSRD